MEAILGLEKVLYSISTITNFKKSDLHKSA